MHSFEPGHVFFPALLFPPDAALAEQENTAWLESTGVFTFGCVLAQGRVCGAPNVPHTHPPFPAEGSRNVHRAEWCGCVNEASEIGGVVRISR